MKEKAALHQQLAAAGDDLRLGCLLPTPPISQKIAA
jgi:hypothetical protein